MRRRAAVAVALMAAMSLFGLGIYNLLGHFKSITGSAATRPPDNPQTTTARLALPGTIYIAQGGDLYALHNTTFTRVLAHDARGSWVQPALLADGNLLVVARQEAFSDLYEVRPDGSVVGRLISNSGSTLPDGSLTLNYWVFYPQPSPDGRTVLFAYDSAGKGDFVHDFAIWEMPLSTPPVPTATPAPGVVRPRLPSGAHLWTTPNLGTGGDVGPIPLASGALLFTRYSLDSASHIHSQIWVSPSPRDPGHALTLPERDCSQPAVSPDGTQLAMICTNGDQISRLVVAPFLSAAAPAATGHASPTPQPTLGAEHVLVDNTLAAQPAWAPDGSGLIYLAPSETGANFQLWWLRGAASAVAEAPVQVTDRLGFDATSAPAWSGA